MTCSQPQFIYTGKNFEQEAIQLLANGMVLKKRNEQKSSFYPEHVSKMLTKWLHAHKTHPYPTADQKIALATETGLTLVQINNWMSNARRRRLGRKKKRKL